MPQIGQDLKTGKIIEWLKKENESVTKGDVVVTVESEKATFDVEAEESGILLKIFFQAGDEAEVLSPIGYIGNPGETPEAGNQRTRGLDDRFAGDRASESRVPAALSSKGDDSDKLLASPVARRLAAERGLTLTDIEGSGPGGRITRRDVEAQAVTRTEDKLIPFSKRRRVIAERLSSSIQRVPSFTLFKDIDMESALNRREADVSINDLVLYAVCRALKSFNMLNAHVLDDALAVKKHVHLGVATASRDGLLVPVIPNADQLSLKDLSGEAREKIERAREGKADPTIAGTFTVSSLGMMGIQRFVPIINPPECAILGVGVVEPRVRVIDGETVIRRMMTVTLVCDHRGVDGDYAARFLDRLDYALQELV